MVVDGLVTLPAGTTELIDAAHQRLLGEDWELVLCLTDVPLRIGRRPVSGHASPAHRVAVVSVPALGAARLHRRAIDIAVDLIGAVLGLPAPQQEDGRALRKRAQRLQRRLVDLAELADQDPLHGPTGLAALARGGRLRLLVGMVRANRPWRLSARLYRALVAAVAAVAFALVTSDVWRVSASLNTARLVGITLLSAALTVTSLVAVHGLWERGGEGRARDQVALFNATTVVTVVLGVASLYLALMALTLMGAGLVIAPDTLSEAIAADVGLGEYLKLAWFASSLATVGGALGAGLESDVAVREAAYAYRRREASPEPADAKRVLPDQAAHKDEPAA